MSYAQSLGKVVAILGSQWGDEGKGKLTDVLGAEYKYIARATGGSNAGHTIKVDGKKYVFHLLPSGILHKQAVCVIGNGCVLHLPTLFMELDRLKENGVEVDGRLFVSDQAHIVFDYHMEIDGQQESRKGDKKVGTTKRGIGPCYTDKMSRIGIRIGDLAYPDQFKEKLARNIGRHGKLYDLDVDPEAEAAKYLQELWPRLAPMVTDTVTLLAEAHQAGEKILVEGANGCFIDIDHGTYPYVTSSSPTVGGVVTGTGIGAGYLTDVIGIVKAYTTRVGAGPFVCELNDELGEKIREQGGEFGSTTGRPRRCGWLDLVMLRKSMWLNSFTELNLTKLDVLQGVGDLKVCVAYKYGDQEFKMIPTDLDVTAKCEPVYKTFPGFTEDISGVREFADLPKAAQDYVEFIEQDLGVQITSIGVGQDREAMIWKA